MPEPAGKRRTGLLVLGIVLLVAGIVGAGALWAASGARFDDSVKNLARAAVGCDTTLDFAETGEFFLFVETKGVVDGVRGDCQQEGSYDLGEAGAPAVTLTMTDPDGESVELRLRSGVDYDAAGFVGQSERVATITTTGDHRLQVVAEDGAGELFAVAVGKDPNDGVALLQGLAIGVGVVGLLAGVVFIVLGLRRRPIPEPAAGPWGQQAAPGWPQSPPGASTPPPAWGTQPPTGPPAGWAGTPPTQPPTQPPPAQSPPAAPQPGGQWGGPVDQPPTRPTPGPRTAPPPSGGAVPGEPPLPGSPGSSGATGDGERSPWAPPQDD